MQDSPTSSGSQTQPDASERPSIATILIGVVLIGAIVYFAFAWRAEKNNDSDSEQASTANKQTTRTRQTPNNDSYFSPPKINPDELDLVHVRKDIIPGSLISFLNRHATVGCILADSEGNRFICTGPLPQIKTGEAIYKFVSKDDGIEQIRIGQMFDQKSHSSLIQLDPSIQCSNKIDGDSLKVETELFESDLVKRFGGRSGQSTGTILAVDQTRIIGPAEVECFLVMQESGETTILGDGGAPIISESGALLGIQIAVPYNDERKWLCTDLGQVLKDWNMVLLKTE